MITVTMLLATAGIVSLIAEGGLYMVSISEGEQ
jgi:hypothetical protein